MSNITDTMNSEQRAEVQLKDATIDRLRSNIATQTEQLRDALHELNQAEGVLDGGPMELTYASRKLQNAVAALSAMSE